MRPYIYGAPTSEVVMMVLSATIFHIADPPLQSAFYNIMHRMPAKTKTTPPKNWPSSIQYVTSLRYSDALSPTQFSTLRTQSVASIPKPPTQYPNPLVKITSITDARHPACGQAGLFAVKDLKPDRFVIEYFGTVHATADADQADGTIKQADPHAASDYDLSLDRYSGLAIDAAIYGNEARFINDYRGIRDRPSMSCLVSSCHLIYFKILRYALTSDVWTLRGD